VSQNNEEQYLKSGNKGEGNQGEGECDLRKRCLIADFEVFGVFRARVGAFGEPAEVGQGLGWPAQPELIFQKRAKKGVVLGDYAKTMRTIRNNHGSQNAKILKRSFGSVTLGGYLTRAGKLL
jgi:hypothetical protein